MWRFSHEQFKGENDQFIEPFLVYRWFSMRRPQKASVERKAESLGLNCTKLYSEFNQLYQ